MLSNDTGEAQDGLAKPAHSEEEEQRAHGEVEVLADLLPVDDQRGAKGEHDHSQGQYGRERSPERCAPSASGADSQHDRESLDEFDRAGEEGRERRGAERQGNVHSLLL